MIDNSTWFAFDSTEGSETTVSLDDWQYGVIVGDHGTVGDMFGYSLSVWGV
jgi:hypothetical protein